MCIKKKFRINENVTLEICYINAIRLTRILNYFPFFFFELIKKYIHIYTLRENVLYLLFFFLF